MVYPHLWEATVSICSNTTSYKWQCDTMVSKSQGAIVLAFPPVVFHAVQSLIELAHRPDIPLICWKDSDIGQNLKHLKLSFKPGLIQRYWKIQVPRLRFFHSSSSLQSRPFSHSRTRIATHLAVLCSLVTLCVLLKPAKMGMSKTSGVSVISRKELLPETLLAFMSFSKRHKEKANQKHINL